MLEKTQFYKFTKPLLTLLLSKAIIFLFILVFLVASHQLGFFSNNPVVSHCDNYISFKISHYQNKIQSVLFLIALVGTLVSGIETGYFTIFYLKIRKPQSSQLQAKIRFSQNHLKFLFVFTFLQSMCLINIFSRSIERLKQQSACSIQGLNKSIVLIILSSLIFSVLVTTYFILFRLCALIRKKILTFEEFKLYSDQMTLKQNLFFNQNGYIQDLFKIQNCSTPSNSLKGKVIKNFPSGFKKNQFLSTREIIHRLRGGNKTSAINEQIKISILNKKDEESSFDQFQYAPKQDALDSKRNLNDKQSLIQKEQNKMTLLQLHQKKFQQNPNGDNLQSIQTTLNVIQVSVNSQKENQKSQDQSNSEDNSIKKKNNQSHKRKGLFKIKEVPVQETPSQKQTIKLKKINKIVPTQFKEEEQLKQKFNLTPNFNARKNHQVTKNYQNIDQNGNYYFVDVEKIKKRTKFLASNNIGIGQDPDNVDPNVLYSKNEWNPKQKRAAKQHEKNIQEYLRNLSRIRKQETLCQEEEQSSGSNSFEESQLSSQMSDSSHQKQEQINVDSQNLDNANPQAPRQSKRQKRENIQKQPQLYLYLKKRKNFRVQYTMKLFDEQEDAQDEQSSSSEGAYQALQQGKDRIASYQMYDGPSIRKQSIEKPKAQEKTYLKNRELETQEARMLRFIRKKYVEPDISKKQSKQKPHLIFQLENITQSNKQVIQGQQKQTH